MAILVTRRQQLETPHLRHQHGTFHQHRCLDSSLGLVLVRWLPVRRTCHHNFKTSTTIYMSASFFSDRYVEWIRSYGRLCFSRKGQQQRLPGRERQSWVHGASCHNLHAFFQSLRPAFHTRFFAGPSKVQNTSRSQDLCIFEAGVISREHTGWWRHEELEVVAKFLTVISRCRL